ncbi:MAG: TIGR03032 family protein, partial [Thermoanaerobaculia bacterium]
MQTGPLAQQLSPEHAEAEAHAAEQSFRSVSSASLSQLLDHLQISLVVSTYQTARVVLVRAESPESINTHFSAFARPMGIAVGNYRLAIGCGRVVWDFRSQPAMAPALEPRERFDACYLPRNVHVTGHIAIHEIAFAGDELWIVNTLFSSLCTLDELHCVVPRWRPPFITGFEPEDRCHLNGLAVVDGQVRYVTAFAETDVANGWRGQAEPSGVIVDVQSNEIVARGLMLPHSPRWYDGRLWVL